jgi:hypothetical protein
MQHVDRIAHIERLAEPARHRRPRVQDEPIGVIARSEGMHGIAGHLRRRRDLGQQSAVGSAEPKLAVRLSIERIALFVDGAVMTATEQREIRECGGASMGPVTDVVPLTEANPAAREAAAAVAVV